MLQVWWKVSKTTQAVHKVTIQGAVHIMERILHEKLCRNSFISTHVSQNAASSGRKAAGHSPATASSGEMGFINRNPYCSSCGKSFVIKHVRTPHQHSESQAENPHHVSPLARSCWVTSVDSFAKEALKMCLILEEAMIPDHSWRKAALSPSHQLEWDNSRGYQTSFKQILQFLFSAPSLPWWWARRGQYYPNWVWLGKHCMEGGTWGRHWCWWGDRSWLLQNRASQTKTHLMLAF